MEIEQLVSIVRHMRAQKQALDYLDEALTRVMDLETFVKEKEAEAKKLDDAIMLKGDALLKIDDEQAQLLKDYKARQDQYKANALAEVEQKLLEKSQAIAQKVVELDKLEAQSEQARIELTKLHSELAALRGDKESVTAELGRIKQAISDLKARL